MKKRVLAFLILTYFTTFLSARCIIFSLTDGSLVYYQLASDNCPMMSFSDSGFTMNDDIYTFGDIDYFYYTKEDAPTSIETVKEMNNTAVLTINNQIITISNTSANISLYTIDGKMIPADIIHSDLGISVDISSIPGGIYILRSDFTSFKFTKK